MRFRTGFILGLAVGYFYGTKAGHDRYRQIDRYLGQLRATGAYQDIRDRVVALMDEGLARSRELVEDSVFGTGPAVPGDGPMPFDLSGDPSLN